MGLIAALFALTVLPSNADSQNSCLRSCQTAFNYCAMHLGQSDFGFQVCSDAQQQCIDRCINAQVQLGQTPTK